MNYLIIEKRNRFIIISDTITNNRIKYIGYTENNAIKKYREELSLKYKRFIKLYI